MKFIFSLWEGLKLAGEMVWADAAISVYTLYLNIFFILLLLTQFALSLRKVNRYF